MQYTIQLASASPRRRDILTQLGYAVDLAVAEIDETPHADEHAYDYVLRMAIEKNRASVAKYGVRAMPVLSADTTVALNNDILGKPESVNDAHRILSALSGSTHQVLTAVCVSHQGKEYSVVQSSDVRFKTLTDDEIRAYIATGEPLDKAGAYGIQGMGGAFVAHLSGSFTGVMGLPVFETVALLRECGAVVPPFLSDLK